MKREVRRANWQINRINKPTTTDEFFITTNAIVVYLSVVVWWLVSTSTLTFISLQLSFFNATSEFLSGTWYLHIIPFPPLFLIPTLRVQVEFIIKREHKSIVSWMWLRNHRWHPVKCVCAVLVLRAMDENKWLGKCDCLRWKKRRLRCGIVTNLVTKLMGKGIDSDKTQW